MDLLAETKALVSASKLPLTDICRATGVKKRWWYAVASGEIPDPSVGRIQRLHNYLSKAKKEATL